MSGVRRSKDFLQSLTGEELKNVKVVIKRSNIPEPEGHLPLYRELDDPKSLRIHFKKESLRGIFDREGIVLNQEFTEEGFKTTSRKAERRSTSSENDRRKGESRRVSYHHESSSRRGRSYRSRSRSSDRSRRNRSRSGSSRKQSRSPPRRKIPGLFIPTQRDYSRLEKRRTRRSRSPAVAHSSKKVDEHSSVDRQRSRRRSRSLSTSRVRSGSPSTSRVRSRSPSISRVRGRTSSRVRRRSPSTSRGRRSRRSRSRSRHYRGEIEEVGPYGNQEMPPCIFRDGNFWVPIDRPFIPRGYIPPPMYPRPFLPPMMMPRMPNIMQPYRQRIQRPRQQTAVPDVAPTSSVRITEVVNNDQNKAKDS